MANFYVSSVAYAAVTQWAALTAYTLGQIRRQLGAVTAGNERCFRCSTAGTSGAAEPTWVLTASATTTDGTAVWTECTAQETYQAAGNWTAPAANYEVIGVNSGGRASLNGTDTVFIASNHSESWTSARSWTRFGSLVCVTVAGSALPPVAASVTTGAQIATTGANNITMGGSGGSLYGITMSLGDAGNSASLNLGVTGGGTSGFVFEACALKLNNTNTGSRFALGGTAVSAAMNLINTVLTFGNASQGISITTNPAFFTWVDTASAIAGTSPTTLFQGTFPFVRMRGVDLSGFTGALVAPGTGSNVFFGVLDVAQCKLNASTVISANYRLGDMFSRISVVATDDTTGNSVIRQAYGAVQSNLGVLSNAIVYRNGGASANSVGYSWSMGASNTTDGAVSLGKHPITPSLEFWNTTTGGAKTITVHGIANKTAIPTNAVAWLQLEYMAASTSPVWSAATNGPTGLPPGSPTNWTATTEDWDDGVPVRQNSHAYSTLGEAVSVASNPGRVFFVTTTGTSAGSEPGGYATAVDGGSVTDNTAVLRAGWRFKMALTVTPQKVGAYGLTIHNADFQAATTLTYIDPKYEIT
ncbi:MAG: hypothetical protein ACEQSH_00185 [Bacteroidia bacterium]